MVLLSLNNNVNIVMWTPRGEYSLTSHSEGHFTVESLNILDLFYDTSSLIVNGKRQKKKIKTVGKFVCCSGLSKVNK